MKYVLGAIGLMLCLGCCCCVPLGGGAPPPSEPTPQRNTLLRGSAADRTPPITRSVPDDSGYTHLWGNIYPGIQVYFWHQPSNTAQPLFQIVDILPDRMMWVRYANGAEEPKSRDAFQDERFIVKKADVVALGGTRSW